MKPKPTKTTIARPSSKASRTSREMLAVAKRMDRMVREENRRWGLPLIVMRDGKIVEEPA
jgi:hypothetical protein